MCGILSFVLEYDLFHAMRVLARAALLRHFTRGTRSIERDGCVLWIGIMYGRLSREDVLLEFFVGLNLLEMNRRSRARVDWSWSRRSCAAHLYSQGALSTATPYLGARPYNLVPHTVEVLWARLHPI